MDTSNSSNSGGGGGGTSELFICFTSSRFSSSSSMRISSKSILSPGRGRDSSQISLSTSLSRRLRSNGSMKGGQASPMFPTTTNGKKRGCGFENPEPSSPKVTCIGQVRVKTKKQGKKIRAARSKSRRGGGGGEVSFRKTEQQQQQQSSSIVSETKDANHYQFQQQECLPHRNQRWVHLPVTICEALRAFGAEFNCFLPCRSSCMASREKEEEKVRSNGGGGGSSNSSSSSCGAVFARWLVAEKIELVVGREEDRDAVEEEEEEEEIQSRRSHRRHVFEDIVIEDAEKFEEKNEILEEEEEEGRVSMCVPPKNALLLMRCRSDPVKMAALANRFWECQVDDEIEEHEHEHEIPDGQSKTEELDMKEKHDFSSVSEQQHQIPETTEMVLDTQGSQEINEAQSKDDQEEKLEETVPVPVPTDTSFEILEDSDNEESLARLFEFVEDESEPVQEDIDDIEEERPRLSCSSIVSIQQEQESEEEEAIVAEEEETEGSVPEEPTQEPETGQKQEQQQQEKVLPDCLLLMMCEPKVSMEVSKETWVCSTDFIRWQPPQKKPQPPPPAAAAEIIVNKTEGCDEVKKRVSIDSKPPLHHHNVQHQLTQPPRSSCSYPAAPPLPRAHGASSMNTLIEQKLMGTKPYEPFVLTRCKSEPMRTASKLAPDSCFWKNRKIEPHHHRPATLGVGAAGVGC